MMAESASREIPLNTAPPSPPLKKPKLEPKPEKIETEKNSPSISKPETPPPPESLKLAITPYIHQNGTLEDLPDDFLEPLPIVEAIPACRPTPLPVPPSQLRLATSVANCPRGSRQFWKAGDYEGVPSSSSGIIVSGGIDHVRVHPKFLHSNATSHKWALGAIAELLDNAMDEVNNGATFVNVDMVPNPKDGGPMLVVEDDGGGMNPDSMRRCMSLGYSAKSKRANTIGQYGNGFKTSTMRLGSDVVVFSRTPGSNGSSPTQSIGMLSYSFLRDTRQEDIIVPMIDYEVEPFGLRKLIRSIVDDWNCNMETIMKWTPFSTESDLLNQFNGMKHQGTKIILYNLWEDDQGQLELDFESDPYDIQVRGANRDEKKIIMAEKFPNSKHYLTYRHSLRSYASILYLRLPQGFRMFLRGKEIEHHNLVDDLMFIQEQTYKPHSGGENVQRDVSNMMAAVTIGFVKDAKEHIDVQGFNVYHKNRLIKPFWRIWNSSSSQGRGIIGVLEANFVEPAHDKQGFERTVVLSRLEMRLLQMQRSYWTNNCDKVGYHSGKSKSAPKTSYPSVRGLRSSEVFQAPGVVTRNAACNQSNQERVSATAARPLYTGTVNSIQPDISMRVGPETTCRSNEEQSNINTRTNVSEKTDSSTPLMQTSETDIESFRKEVARNKLLQAKVSELENKICDIRGSMERVIQERDALKVQLQGEFRQRAIQDDELRTKLKDAYIRIKQLEAERRCSGDTSNGTLKEINV